jgi:hypothetical protein
VSIGAGTTNVSTTNVAIGRICADGGDAVSYSVTALTSTTATLVSSPSAGCLSANDEVLLINLQGTAAANANVGNYETLRVQSVTGATVTFIAAKTKSYGSGVADDANLGTTATTQRVVLVRIPNFSSITVAAGGTLTADGWNGVKGGVLFARSSGAVNVAGSISMDGKGYRGGPRPTMNNQIGNQGESYGGLGAGVTTANLGGGGAGQGEACSSYGSSGGGASYATAGANGTTACTGRGATTTYGDTALTKLFFGSGGGSGGDDNTLADNPAGGLGGGGGGILVLKAASITVTGSITARGLAGQGDATAGCSGSSTTNCWDFSGAGGGGAGGSLYLSGNTVSVGTSLVSGVAGVAGLGGSTNGGAGGVGRIAVRYATTVTGTTTPAADVAVGP